MCGGAPATRGNIGAGIRAPAVPPRSRSEVGEVGGHGIGWRMLAIASPCGRLHGRHRVAMLTARIVT